MNKIISAIVFALAFSSFNANAMIDVSDKK